MPKVLRVRALSSAEADQIKGLAHSRTEPARTVERAKIIWLAHQGERVPAIARRLQVSADSVRLWLKRFNAQGLGGLQDEPRSGRPCTYTPEQVGEVIGAVLTHPQSLGLPFASWTLDRLEAYLNETKGIPLKRSRLDELLIAEGLRWRAQETWFSERAALGGADLAKVAKREEVKVDPDFAAKRGPSKSCIPSHRQVVSS